MPSKLRALRRGTALTRSERKKRGPVQIVVLGFENLNFQDDILPELRRLRGLEIVRVVDMVVVTKSTNGELVGVKASDLTEKQSDQLEGIAAALAGLGAGAGGIEPDANVHAEGSEARGFLGDERTWSVADAIPAGTMAVVVLIEHRWAIPLRDAVQRAGGVTLADAWIHPADLAFYEALRRSEDAS